MFARKKKLKGKEEGGQAHGGEIRKSRRAKRQESKVTNRGTMTSEGGQKWAMHAI